MKYFLTICLLTLCTSCKYQDANNSRSKGHFENSNAEQLATYDNKLRTIAEYNPVGRVVVSHYLIANYQREDLIVEIAKSNVDEVIILANDSNFEKITFYTYDTLRELAGEELLKKIKVVYNPKSGKSSSWARDWAPIGALDENNKLHLLDFNYRSISRTNDDYSGQILSKELDIPRVSIPLYNEGGNFMTNALGHCMLSDLIVDSNKRIEFPGDTIKTPEEIINYFKTSAGCKKVTIFPSLPHEGTRHIDMWAKFLNDQTILVNELRETTIATMKTENSKKIAQEMKDFLDQRAKEIAALGYTVKRIPMPAPSITSRGNIVRTYSNALFVNGHAIIPRYKGNLNTPALDDTLLPQYEAEVSKTLQDAGFKTTFIVSNGMIYDDGAVHCTTMQWPK